MDTDMSKTQYFYLWACTWPKTCTRSWFPTCEHVIGPLTCPRPSISTCEHVLGPLTCPRSRFPTCEHVIRPLTCPRPSSTTWACNIATDMSKTGHWHVQDSLHIMWACTFPLTCPRSRFPTCEHVTQSLTRPYFCTCEHVQYLATDMSKF